MIKEPDRILQEENLLFASRIEKVKVWLQTKGIGSFLVTKLVNIRYLTGFSGSAGICFITPEKAVLITDSRYTLQARQETSGIEVRQCSKILEELEALLSESRPKRLAYEADFISFSFYKKLGGILRKRGRVRAVANHGLVESLRIVKDAGEIDRICRAIDTAEQAFRKIREMIRPGVSERDIAVELEYQMRRLGAKKSAFDIIVASGPRSALPHAVASDRIIQKGDLVVMDFGCQLGGYHSDITRTFIIGSGSSVQKNIHNIVRQAQEKCFTFIRPGTTSKAVDLGARNHIDSSGYGYAFSHGTGHGVGLEVHEEPRIYKDNPSVLQTGCVFTIEPGIYLENIGGVRIEDMVLVTEKGFRILTNLSREPDPLTIED